jgi:flagellar hook assembly protein FlgD
MKKLLAIALIMVVAGFQFISPCYSQGRALIVQANTRFYGGDTTGTHPGDNVAAIWIQTDQGTFLLPLMVWSLWGFDIFLKTWRTASGLVDTGYYDGVTSPTREYHDDTLLVIWDCKDSSGNSVPNGTYEFCVEMTETEYWWQPDEEYFGKFAKGTIEIGDEEKVVEVNSTDTCIYNFKARYHPTGIVYQNKNLQSKKSLSYRYNSARQNLTVKLHTSYDNSAVLNIFRLNGELLNTVRICAETGEFYWDLRNNSGDKIPAGVYLFHVYSGEGKQFNKAFSITLLR